MTQMDPVILEYLEYVLRLALSALFGGAIGYEREIRLKGAGLRTHLIVAVAACLMMLVSKYGFFDILERESVSLDPSRIAASVVTGISFLGAGTIFSRGRNVTGLTTAAGLWATVGIGMAVGAGMYVISAFTTVFILAIQAILHKDFSIFAHSGADITIQIADDPETLAWLIKTLSRLGLGSAGSRYERSGGLLSVELETDSLPCAAKDLPKLFQPLTEDPRIKSIRW